MPGAAKRATVVHIDRAALKCLKETGECQVNLIGEDHLVIVRLFDDLSPREEEEERDLEDFNAPGVH